MSVHGIDVVEHGDGFRITVNDGSGRTTHDVSLPADYLDELGLADVDRRMLVVESFRFLLEREPKESIMRSFELSVIQRYFPEYPDEIRARMSA